MAMRGQPIGLRTRKRHDSATEFVAGALSCAMVHCPKCGLENAPDAVICPGCDFILDVSFLGDDFLNQTTAVGEDDKADGGFGGEAYIVGSIQRPEGIDSFMSEATGSFLTAETGEIRRIVLPTTVYVDRSTQIMLEPNAVLRIKPGTDLQRLQLSPFEMHVVQFVDGERPVARIRKRANLSMSDTKIALAMIVDRGVLQLVGNVTAVDLGDDLGASEEGEPLEPPAFEGPTPQDEAPPPTAPAPVAPVAPTVRAAPAPVALLPGSAISVLRPSDAVAPSIVPMVVDDEADIGRKRAALGLYELALADLRAGKKTRAYMYAKQARDAYPDSTEISALLADWANAEKFAVQQTADHKLFMQAVEAEDRGEYAQAIHLMREAIAINPAAAELHNRIGVIMATRLADYSSASNALMRAVELEPKNLVYRSNLGKVFKMSEGKRVDALIADGHALDNYRAPTKPASVLDRLRDKLK